MTSSLLYTYWTLGGIKEAFDLLCHSKPESELRRVPTDRSYHFDDDQVRVMEKKISDIRTCLANTTFQPIGTICVMSDKPYQVQEDGVEVLKLLQPDVLPVGIGLSSLLKVGYRRRTDGY